MSTVPLLELSYKFLVFPIVFPHFLNGKKCLQDLQEREGEQATLLLAMVFSTRCWMKKQKSSNLYEENHHLLRYPLHHQLLLKMKSYRTLNTLK